MKMRWMILALAGSTTLLGAQNPTPPAPPPGRTTPPRPAPRPERVPRADQPTTPAPRQAPRPPSETMWAEPLLSDVLTGELFFTPMLPTPAELPMLAELAMPAPTPMPAAMPELFVSEFIQGIPHTPVAPEPPGFHFEPFEVHAPMPAEFFGGASHIESVRVPASWARQDVGDSLWRSARTVFNRGDWGQAAQLFQQIPQRYPNSAYAADALYYQAHALYRIGRTEDLRTALSLLETRAQRYPNARSQQSDAPALAMRIRGVLASRGDQAAAAELARQASQGTQTCDREEQAVQAEAMNALSRTDPENVNQLITRVLARRDECAIPLRRTAVFLAGNRRDAGAAAILTGVARNDPSLEVRVEAINWLGRLPSEEGLPVLEELVRTSDEERIQRAAVRALVQHPSTRARTAVRSLVERNDVSDRLRSEALAAFTPQRATADDITWLRALYARMETPQLKQRTLSAITRIGGPEVDQWLVTLVRNDNEPSEIRSTAMRRIGKTLPIADLGRLYDDASQQRLRMEIISVLASRTEDAAADKLLDIAKNGTDPNLRTRAINALSSRNDARARALLLELINK
ncbi:MAG TPA: HEAT repeat domain-containing protein [Gemmatimonadaceae bacterium]|nr:HEAT repeat domain-containing protein [Gemmatimonadaceae bacterium]